MQRVIALGCLLLVAACASPQGLQQGNLFEQSTEDRSILLMPIDVEVSTLTAGGLNEPNAEWTTQASRNLETAVILFGAARNVTLVDYAEPVQGSADGLLHTEIRALHRAVGDSIRIHKFGPIGLPTKAEVFDWSLGPEVQTLRDQSNADYALFMVARDSFSSGGRVALQIAASIVGIGVQGGTQVAYISLIDLNTGDVSWFNYNLQATGDIRNPEGAALLVEKLLKTLPIAGTQTASTSP